MRIGIDVRILAHPRSGIAVYTICLLEQFQKIHGIEVILFGDRFIYEEYKPITDKFKTVIFGQERRKYWAQFYLPAQLKKHKIDIYHAVWNNAVPIFTTVPSVLTVHDVIPLVVDGYFKNKIKRYKYILSMFCALKKAKIITTDSRSVKTDLIRYFKTPADKIKIVYLGIDLQHSQKNAVDSESVLSKIGVAKTDYIINIGSFDRRRNADILITAFSKFAEKSGGNFKLVIVGGYNNFKEQIKKLKTLACEMNLSKKIVFTNYISEEEKLVLLSKAKMMVHLSLYEGFCFPVLEAMRAGTPVIASSAGSIPEVVGDAAMLVGALDVDMAAGAMEKLHVNNDFRQAFVKKGLDRVKNFPWAKTALATFNIYKEVA